MKENISLFFFEYVFNQGCNMQRCSFPVTPVSAGLFLLFFAILLDLWEAS